MKNKARFSTKKLTENEQWRAKKIWLKNEAAHGFWINDAGKLTPYVFECPNCKMTSTEIKITTNPHLNVYSVPYKGLPNLFLEQEGGKDDFYTWLQCDVCTADYYIGLGYLEPNNGRDVFFLKRILEMEKC